MTKQQQYIDSIVIAPVNVETFTADLMNHKLLAFHNGIAYYAYKAK